jgi:DNA primase
VGEAVDPRHRAGQVLTVILLNHPRMFDSVGEAFGRLAFVDPGLDALRQALVSVLTREPGLDVKGLREELTSAGMTDAVDALLRDPLVAGHRYLEPDAADEDVRATWEENLGLLRTAALVDEKERVKKTLAGDLTEEEWRRTRAVLRSMVEEEDPR